MNIFTVENIVIALSESGFWRDWHVGMSIQYRAILRPQATGAASGTDEMQVPKHFFDVLQDHLR